MNNTELLQARNQYQAKVKENNEVIERKKRTRAIKTK